MTTSQWLLLTTSYVGLTALIQLKCPIEILHCSVLCKYYTTDIAVAHVICIPLQKRKEREATILKNSKLNEDQKKKWTTVITNDFMSSEESGEDDTIVVHPLPWRSEIRVLHKDVQEN